MTELAQLLAARTHALVVTTRQRLLQLKKDERGSFTVEQALWAAAAIGFVTAVVVAITVYLNNQIAKIR
ncbi:MAG: hypothetical protein QM779_15305 [Propionicimonas sp.]|uniref:hypothetical protein n=1 Tax=Propionicimonas sp. TaxID=1955623 RepID=UPI003D141022